MVPRFSVAWTLTIGKQGVLSSFCTCSTLNSLQLWLTCGQDVLHSLHKSPQDLEFDTAN